MPRLRLRSFHLVLPLLLIFTLPALIHAEDTAKRWTVDDLVLAEDADDWDLSPDGRLAVWVRSTVVRVKGEEKRVSNLWISDLGGSQYR